VDALRGASTRMTMMGGRDTVVRASTKDPAAEGWERVIEAGACAFCAMLAGRGAVYKESTVDFRAHDHCHCTARAVFKGQASINQDLSDAWGQVTKGRRGAAARAAWTEHWENRNVNTGSGNGPGTAEAGSEGPGHAGIIGRERGPAEVSHS
jgi:hypothetical protein